MAGPEREATGEREAVRRAQRIARQLHQVLAASIAVASLRSEEELLTRLAERVRGVFDAAESVVSLHTGPAAPLRVTAQRSGAARADHGVELPFGALDDAGPRRDGPWLVAPIPVRRRGSRGVIAVRRPDDVGFGDDDAEILTLLAQMASSALDAAELDRAIESSEARWRVLVETAPIGIVETDEDGSVRWWNRAAGGLFGWGPDAEALPAIPDAVVAQLAPIWRLAHDGPVAVDLEPVELDGRRRDLSVAAALLEAPDGAAPTMLTLVDDETDKNQLLDELRHAQRMEVIGQLSSSVAHDFNNLLTLIAGYAELLHHETGDNPRADQLIVDIVATTTRAKTLTGKLLTMGRSKTPEPVVFSPVGLVGALAEVLDRIVGAAIQVSLELDGASGNVKADPDQFEQTVLNLAVNARDAMPEGGRLSVRVASHVVEDPAGPGGVAAGPYVELLTVSDTGSGMDAETAAKCFEPLFTTKGPGKGTGLGLPAARRVVTEAGGAIFVASAPDEGTTFRILLPVVDEEVTQPSVEVADVRPLESGTVLLAEDEDGIRRMVARVLAHDGFDVLEADSGEAALEVAAGFDGVIDLLVSDVVMGLTGRELAERLQAERPELQVVLVSGNVESSVLESLVPGSAAFLAKPFRPSQLVDVVRELRATRGDAPGR